MNPDPAPEIDPGLAEMARMWPRLQPHTRKALVALAQDAAAPAPKPLFIAGLHDTWRHVRFTFLTPDRVHITTATQGGEFSVSDLGLLHGRHKTPRAEWRVLQTLAYAPDYYKSIRSGNWHNRICALRKLLCAKFGLADDPFHKFNKAGWQPKFKIGAKCRPDDDWQAYWKWPRGP